MNAQDATGEADRRQKRSRLRLVLGIACLALYIGIFFLIAGRLDWVRGWGFVALITCGQTVHTVYLRRKNPELMKRRARIGRGTKKWDKTWLALFGLLYMVIIYVAAFDVGRYGGAVMPGWLWPMGAALYVIFLVIITWAMSVNPHFEKTVRIQEDRHHKVVDSGPYRLVRHPGYLCAILGFVLTPPLLLGSWWAMIPAGITAGWLVLRTALEDRTLRNELEGYDEYAKRVPFRLIPRVW